MAKTYDIGNSPQIGNLRGATVGTDLSGATGAVKKKKKQNLAEQIFSDPQAVQGNAKGNAFLQGLSSGGVGGAPAMPGTPWSGPPSLGAMAVGQQPPKLGPFAQPGMGETYVSDHLNDFTQPTNSQGVFDKGGFNTPTASENFNSQYGAQIMQPGPSTGFYNQNQAAFNTPGASENWFATHGAQFDKPGAAEDFYAQHQGDLANMPGISNRSEEAYQHLKGNMPNIAMDAGLDPYYKHAAQVGTQNLNTQLAARGAYGSSVGTGQIGNLLQGLGAEQANRESQYNLDRLAEQRGWEGLQGQLAQGADSSSGRVHDAKLNDILGFGNLAQAAGASSLSRLLGASGSAAQAQGAQTSRLNAGSSAASNADSAQTARFNAGSSAAGQASNATLARQGLELNAAGQADSQRLAGLTAGTSAALGGQAAQATRGQNGINNVMNAVNAAMSIVGPQQQQQIQADYTILNDKTIAKAARVAAAQRIAETASQGDKAMFAQMMATFVAVIG